MHLGVGYVSLVRLGAGHDERRIVTSPDDERRRSVLTQPGLPRRIRCDIRAIVVQQIALDFPLPWARKKRIFVSPVRRIVSLGTGAVSDVTKPRRFERH